MYTPFLYNFPAYCNEMRFSLIAKSYPVLELIFIDNTGEKFGIKYSITSNNS